jgi:catechol 2,3-dioxygenase-like lactoylglutathione lyase family enzyme
MEHLGYQVKDPVKVAAWYCENLGFTIVRAVENEAKTRFVADSAGTMMLEIYNNPTAPVPDYASMNPLVLHLAFLCSDIPATVKKLTAAGAKLLEEFTTPQGDGIAMLRDPWGMAIQFCNRKTPMIKS